MRSFCKVKNCQSQKHVILNKLCSQNYVLREAKLQLLSLFFSRQLSSQNFSQEFGNLLIIRINIFCDAIFYLRKSERHPSRCLSTSKVCGCFSEPMFYNTLGPFLFDKKSFGEGGEQSSHERFSSCSSYVKCVWLLDIGVSLMEKNLCKENKVLLNSNVNFLSRSSVWGPRREKSHWRLLTAFKARKIIFSSQKGYSCSRTDMTKSTCTSKSFPFLP